MLCESVVCRGYCQHVKSTYRQLEELAEGCIVATTLARLCIKQATLGSCDWLRSWRA